MTAVSFLLNYSWTEDFITRLTWYQNLIEIIRTDFEICNLQVKIRGSFRFWVDNPVFLMGTFYFGLYELCFSKNLLYLCINKIEQFSQILEKYMDR